MMIVWSTILTISLAAMSCFSATKNTTAAPAASTKTTDASLTPKMITNPLSDSCFESLKSLPDMKMSPTELKVYCQQARQLASCQSVNNKPIFHFEKEENANSKRNILVFAVVHGDEPISGSVAIEWANRLNTIDSRSHWRIIPMLNPDGYALKKRMNQNGIDLNRNFPSKDWNAQALKKWSRTKNPRRYPGKKAASEPETLCAMAHIEEFKPEFVVAIHTPYGVLDFDGPKPLNFPSYTGLAWKSLGTFPGSLGRYMWKDQNVPVLTIELRDQRDLARIDQIHKLQDITGTVAIRTNRRISQNH